MLLKQLLASLLRALFRIKAFHPHYYGLHKRIITPFKLFHGVSRTIRFHPNLILHLDIEDWIPQQLYLLGKYEEKELRFVKAFLNPGDLFVDIGANFGLYSLLASEVVGKDGVIYAFEPYPDNYKKLIQHLESNAIKNVIAEKLAISSSDTAVELTSGAGSLNSGMISEFTSGSGPIEIVPATTLDKYASQHFHQPIKLIKLDIEGGEYKAILGMQHKVLKEDRPYILMELEADLLKRAGTSGSAIESFLADHNYSKRYLGEDGSLIAKREKQDNSQNCVFVPV